MEAGQLITSGVDLWLNTPQKPQAASGSSGMKAGLNGVPSLSILDGWWIEGCIEGVNGWSIGSDADADGPGEAGALYEKLERTILSMFYRPPERYAAVMRSSIALNGYFQHSKNGDAVYCRCLRAG
jgi:starch phosphorylase